MRKFFRLFLAVCLSLAWCASGAGAAENPYWDFSIYASKDPRQLAQKSIDSESGAEKVRIRSFLAARYPQTAEGLFSRAWIAGYEGKAADSQRLYQECVDQYPKFAVCLNNVMDDSADDLVPIERLMALDAAYNDYGAVRSMYTALGNAARAEQQKALRQRIGERFNGKWIVPFLDYQQALESRDRAAQRSALRRAKAAPGGAPFFVHQALISLDIGYFFQGGNRQEIASGMVAEYLGQTGRLDEYAPWKYLMEISSGPLDKAAILRQFVTLYDQFASSGSHPQPIPAEALNAVNLRNEASAQEVLGPWLRQFRARFAARRATEPAVADSLLWYETATDGPLQALIPQWRQLVANALTEKDAVTYTHSATDALVRLRHDCTQAQRLTSGWDQRFAGALEYHRNVLEASLCANELGATRRHVDAVARLSPQDNASDRTDRLRLAMAEAQAKAWSEHESRNPFLKQWDQKDGAEVALNIEFATGAAIIPAQYAEPLNRLARLLKENGAADYQFDIAGHTDSRGSAALNQKLSEQRAQAVVEYLATRAGIERVRLTYSGHGSAVPLASNATAVGMQQNRRVEITPRANLRTPALTQAGIPTGSSVALSPDGRVLATSDALWDVKTRLKLRDLPSAAIRHMEFLANGRFLLRLCDLTWATRSERVLEMIDVSSGLILRRQLLGSGVEKFAISPDGRQLAMVNDGQVLVYALPSLQLRQERMLSVVAGSGKVAWLGNDRLAASVRFGGEKLHLLSADTLATLKVFDGITYVHTIGVSRSGKYLAAITNDGGTLHVWDTQGWQHRSQEMGVYATQFYFHPFEEKALIDQWNGSDLKTRLIDLESMRVTKVSDANLTPAFTPDGKHFFAGSGNEYDFATFKAQPWVASQAGNDGASFGAWLPGTRQFMTEDGKDSLLWDVASGRQIDRLVGLRLCGRVTGSPTLYWKCQDPSDAAEAMVEPGSWRVIPGPSAFKAGEKQSTQEKTATRVVLFEPDAAPSAGRMSRRGKLSIVDRQSGATLATHPMLLRLEDPVYAEDDALDRGGMSSAVDPSGRYLALRVWWQEHWGYAALSGKQVWIYDLESGKEVDRLSLNVRAEKLSFAPGGGARLRIGTANDTAVYDVVRKTWESNLPWTEKETLQAEAGSLKLVALGDKLTLIQAGAPDRYVFVRKSNPSVQLYPEQNLMLVYYGNGEFDYYDLKTLSRQLTLHAKSKGEWLAYAPSGEFSASLKGTQGYLWALGDKYLPFGALRERFERPDIIGRQLQNVVRGTATAPQALTATSLAEDSASSASPGAPRIAPIAQAGSAGAPVIEADLFMPPFSLRLIDPPARSGEAKLILKVGVTKLRAIGVEPEIELNINGQQVKTRGLLRVSAGKTCAAAAGQVGCEQIIDLPVTLEDGRNVLGVSLLYRNARLDTQSANIELERPRQAARTAPRLWLLAAGVSEYADARQNLKFAHRDAEELARLLKLQEGKLYSQVNVKLLTNAQVAKGSLETEINRFLRQASDQDLVVILLAGHGVQDNDQTLYFMTHDANMDEPFSGMDVTRIRDILRNRPSNQKAILLLDICHAGAVGEGKRGTVSADDAVRQLSLGTGITVLASSAGRELSNEGVQYRGGHGAFTAALLEGLEGAADQEAGNRDGVVSISELMTYVMQRVPVLTRGGQHPNMPSSDRLLDYPLSMKP